MGKEEGRYRQRAGTRGAGKDKAPWRTRRARARAATARCNPRKRWWLLRARGDALGVETADAAGRELV